MHRVTLADGSVVRIHCTGWQSVGSEWGELRRRFRWTVRDTNGAKLASGWDLWGGNRQKVTEREMASTFADFLGAWVEALAYGDEDSENRDLFPETMREWAEANSEELYLLTMSEDIA